MMTAQGLMINYHSVYLPATVLYSTIIFVLFAMFSIVYPFRVLIFMEHCMLCLYTAITRRIHLPKHRMPQRFTPSISFMGGGHLWMFAIGVGHYIFENFDIDNIKFLASSSGCFAAVPLACGMDPYAWCHRDWAKCMTHFDSRLLGCLCDSKWFYHDLWNEYLPDNAHIRCSGRLFVSITEFPSMRNRVVSHFETREELIWVIVASMCLPIAFILDFPVNCGSKIGLCFDGGFSNDSPCLDSYTITVSALHREADIKPAMDLMSMSDEAAMQAAGVDPNEVSDYDRNIRIRAIDVLNTPKFSRVWQVGGIGERAAANCVDFERHEWMSIRSTVSPAADTTSSSTVSASSESNISAFSSSSVDNFLLSSEATAAAEQQQQGRGSEQQHARMSVGTRRNPIPTTPVSERTVITRSSTGKLKPIHYGQY